MKNKILKGAVIIGVAALSAFGGAGIHAYNQEPIDVDAINSAAFEQGVNSVDVAGITLAARQEGIDSVDTSVETVTITNTVTETIEVDNGNLDLVLNEIFDNDGSVEYLTEDLEDDELDEIVGRIEFINEAKTLAIAETKAELADELDNVEVIMKDGSTIKLDEDDFEKLRIDDDEDEITVSNIDYEDRDVEVEVTGRFRHDDTWFTFEASVEIEDNEVDKFKVIDVQEE